MPVLPSPCRPLVLVCLTCGAWAFSFGLSSQVVSHWLASLGYSNSVIGFNHTGYYLGLGLGSLVVPVLMRCGGRWCAVAGMILSSLTLALFPWGNGEDGYFCLRFLNGAAGALALIPLETLVSRSSDAQDRTRNFAYYGVALTLGGALGIWVGLNWYVLDHTLAFVLGGIFPVLSGMALARWLPAAEAQGRPSLGVVATFPLDVRGNFLSFGTAWAQGFLEGGMLAFLTLYLLSLGMSADEAGAWMGVTLVGVIAFQVPVSWLADRLGRVPVLLACYAVTAGALLIVPLSTPGVFLAVVLFLFGACSGAMYPLGLSLLGERVAEAALARAYAWYLAMECLGSQLGAAAMGEARDRWGEASMFAVGLAALGLVLAGWGVVRKTKRRKIIPKEWPAQRPAIAAERSTSGR